jgi:hypothetical protein
LDKEPQAPDYYLAILSDMEAKRTALDTAIAGLRAAIAAGILGAFGEFPAGAVASNATVVPTGAADLPRGAFLGKTATEAIKLYLSTIRKKQTNKEIAQALRDGGLESAGDFGNYITSALFRLKKEGTVLRFDDGWGLSEWYNEAFRAKLGVSSSKKPTKRNKNKQKKPAKKETPRVALVLTAPQEVARAAASESGALDRRIEALLDSKSPVGIPIQDIAVEVGAPVGTVNFAIVRLAKRGFARRGDDGKVYSTSERQ